MAVIKIVPMPGAEGQKGDPGATGAQGPQGPQGLQGPAGADALWNYNGEWSSSATYAEGDIVTYNGQTYRASGITILATTPDLDVNFDLIAAKGADGIIGVDGAQGPQGEVGPQGPQGEQGVQGEQGLQGVQGIQGEQGIQGIQGEQGIQGPAGANGADALWNFVGEYNNGADYWPGDVVTYAGGTYYRVGEPNPGYPPGTVYWTTIAEPGADGAQGIQGEPGPQGPQGIQGETGPSAGISYKSGVPANPTATGQVGQLSIDGVNGVLYVCTGTNTWQKVSLNSANFTNPGGFA